MKIGTKVKGIRLVDGDHDIDCKIDGFGAMKLKSEFVEKVWDFTDTISSKVQRHPEVAQF